MKKLIVALIVLCQVSFTNGQNKVINNIVKFKIKNSGAFLDDQNNADGYYFFYEVDKLKNKQKEYAINILDKNLNDVATKKFIASKKTALLDSKFNNEVTMFAFFDYAEKKITLKSYDKNANQREDIIIPVEKKMAKYYRTYQRMGKLNNVLLSVKNKGFLLKLPDISRKGTGFILRFYATNKESKDWKYQLVEENKKNHDVSPVAINKDFMVFIDVKSKLFSSKKEFRTFVIDTKTGKKLFETLYDKNDPKLTSNAFISKKNEVVVLGQYYKPNAKIAKDQSLGLYVDIFNTKGEITYNQKISWAEDINKFLPIKKGSKLKDIGYIFFHDIIRTQNGDFYAIGEQFKKTVSAVGVTTAIIGGLLGGVQTSGFTQLTIRDAYVFKFDKEFQLKNVEVFKKGTSRIQNLYDFGSPQLSAFEIKARGGFDYVYSQIDKKRDRFYANFIDYERSTKDTKARLVFKTIIYDEGSLSEDKIILKKRSINFRVLPGKLGYVLLLDYNKKRRQATMHLEKLNIK